MADRATLLDHYSLAQLSIDRAIIDQ